VFLIYIYIYIIGDLYICGCGGSDYITGDRLRQGGDAETAELIHADPARIAAALQSLHSMTSIGDSRPDIMQACMRPCTPDALPVMGNIPNYTGAYISAGHNCWGILWAPVSGLAMAEMLIEDKCNVIDLTAFDPARYMQTITSQQSQRGRKKGSEAVGEQW
jgi:glycine/D-amino acid oxidase-like deaminating enzyme